MGSPCLFTRQQALKLGYFYWLRVKNSNPLLTELSLCYLKHTKFYLEHRASFIQISSIASFNSIANQEAVCRSPALLLRIEALALQKLPLFVLFALVGRTAAFLNVAMLCAVEGAQCKQGRPRGRVVSSSDSQSGGPGFESRSGHLLDLCSVVPSSNSRPRL